MQMLSMGSAYRLQTQENKRCYTSAVYKVSMKTTKVMQMLSMGLVYDCRHKKTTDVMEMLSIKSA